MTYTRSLRGQLVSPQYDYLEMSKQLGILGNRPRGREEIYTLCPFHRDRSPSFGLNIKTGLWVCHRGCGSGDFTRLVMRVLNVGVREASTWILNNGNKVSLDVVSNQVKELLRSKLFEKVKNLSWLDNYQALNP